MLNWKSNVNYEDVAHKNANMGMTPWLSARTLRCSYSQAIGGMAGTMPLKMRHTIPMAAKITRWQTKKLDRLGRAFWIQSELPQLVRRPSIRRGRSANAGKLMAGSQLVVANGVRNWCNRLSGFHRHAGTVAGRTTTHH